MFLYCVIFPTAPPQKFPSKYPPNSTKTSHCTHSSPQPPFFSAPQFPFLIALCTPLSASSAPRTPHTPHRGPDESTERFLN